jgi:t-SNARE complex subunit (syntaxin)
LILFQKQFGKEKDNGKPSYSGKYYIKNKRVNFFYCGGVVVVLVVVVVVVVVVE